MAFELPLPAFYSYAHKNGKDRKHLEQLRDALALVRRQKVLDDWDDSKIRAGQEWEDLLIERARTSRVFLLVLTNRFIASDFCVGTELTIARRLYDSRVAAIAPILAEEANWQIDELKDLHVIMPFGKPVSASKRSDAWTAVGGAIKQMAEDFAKGTYFAAPAPALPAIPPLLPYTIGRQEETEIVRRAIAAAPADRPFVCVLTGERQGQSEFVDYLLSDEGPVRQDLHLSAAYDSVELSDKAWIRSRGPVEPMLNEALAAQLEPPPESPDREGIAARLVGPSGVTVIRCDLSAAEWKVCGDGRLRQFAEYWTSWPESKHPGRVLVFVSIRAEGSAPDIPGVVWVPFRSVSQGEATEWLATPAARRQFLVDRIQAHLPEIFGGRDRLCMEEFAPRLLPVLRKLQV